PVRMHVSDTPPAVHPAVVLHDVSLWPLLPQQARRTSPRTTCWSACGRSSASQVRERPLCLWTWSPSRRCRLYAQLLPVCPSVGRARPCDICHAETQWSNASIIIISPDSDNLSVLQVLRRRCLSTAARSCPLRCTIVRPLPVVY